MRKKKKSQIIHFISETASLIKPNQMTGETNVIFLIEN